MVFDRTFLCQLQKHINTVYSRIFNNQLTLLKKNSRIGVQKNSVFKETRLYSTD